MAFESVPATPVGADAAAWAWLETALLRATVAVAAEQVGGADRALEIGRRVRQAARAVRSADRLVPGDQAPLRRLGRRERPGPLGDGARGLGGRAGDGRQLAEAAAMAALVCGPAFARAAQECIQIHGGIGFTWEHPAHRYFRRAKADLVVLDDLPHYRERLLAALGV